MIIRPLFDKYQHLLVKFANTEFGRGYLGARSLPILKVSPDGITYYLGYDKNKFYKESCFYPRSPYLKKFRLALESMSIVEDAGLSLKNWFDHPEFVIPHFQNLIAPKPWLPLLMRTESTFNPDAHVETTSVDGNIANTGTVYTTVQGATSGDSNTESTDSAGATQNEKSGADFLLGRAVFLFDTSALPDTDIISAAIFSMYVNFIRSASGESVRIVTSTPASNTALVNGDFDQFGTTSLANEIALSSLTDDAHNDFTLNSTGRGEIDATGISKFGARDTGDIDVTEPTVEDSVTVVNYAETVDSGLHPKLVVTHSADASGTMTTNTKYW